MKIYIAYLQTKAPFMTAWQDACVSFAIGMTGSDIRGGYDKKTVGVASEGGGLADTLDCAETFLAGEDPRVTKCKPHDRALRT